MPVDLALLHCTQPQQRPPKPVYISIKADGSIAIGDDPVPRDSFASALIAATQGDKDQRLFVQGGDKSVPYGDVMQVMKRAARRGLSQGRAGRHQESRDVK